MIDIEVGHTFDRRSALFLTTGAVLTSVLVLRMLQMQVFNYRDYKKKSENNSFRIQINMPERGKILSTEGIPISRDTPIYRIYIVPEETENLDELLNTLTTDLKLREKTIKRIWGQIRKQQKFQPVLISEHTDWKNLARVQAKNLPGVHISSGFARVYEMGESGAHIFGYVGAPKNPVANAPFFTTGILGLEKRFNDEMAGTPGQTVMLSNAVGRITGEDEDQYIKPVAGNDIKTTVRWDAQRVLYDALIQHQAGCGVALDIENGDILAMTSAPGFDAGKFTSDDAEDYMDGLLHDYTKPFVNKTVEGLFPPGSTFKMLTSITGLEEGNLYPGRLIVDQGQFTKVSPAAKCWRYPGNHGAINVSQALAFSCNYFFYETGYELSLDSHGNFDNDLGISKLRNYGTQLGINEKSGVEIEENDPIFTTQDAVRSAIGQGSNSFANIQLARYTTTIANSGKNYKLTLLDKVTDTEGNTLTEFQPQLENTTTYRDSTWNAVHEGMRMVVTGGTAKTTFKDFQISVAGKSGTAQENKLRSNHAVFVAYAPYENPEIALSVVIPNGESSGYNAEVIRDTIKYYYGLTTDEELYGGVASVPTSGVTSD